MNITVDFFNDEIRKWRKIHKNPHTTMRVYYYGIYRGLIMARRLIRIESQRKPIRKKGKK